MFVSASRNGAKALLFSKNIIKNNSIKNYKKILFSKNMCQLNENVEKTKLNEIVEKIGNLTVLELVSLNQIIKVV